MKILKRPFIIFSCIIVMSIMACKQDKLTVDGDNQVEINKDKLIEVFAISLSNSLELTEMRLFLKEQSLMKIDGDYNVIVNLVKDMNVNKLNRSFIEVLESYNSSNISISKIIEKVPKLDIRFPSLIFKNVNNWDTESLHPIVAIRNEVLIGDNYMFKAFDSGIPSYISAEEEPSEITIVIGENERIYTSSILKSNNKSKELFTSNGIKYVVDKYELSEDFIELEILGDKSNDQGKSSREKLYYKSGSLNYNIKETLTHFRLNSGRRVRDIFESNSWADGALEIECFMILGGQDENNFKSIKSVQSISRNGLAFVSSTTSSEFANTFFPGKNPFNIKKLLRKQYDKFAKNWPANLTSSDGKRWYPMKMQFHNWSPHRYGDVVKLIFKEVDNGATITKVIDHSVGFDASIGKKDKFNIGLNGEKSGKTTISYIDKSDELGEALVYYYEDYGLNNYRTIGDVQFVLEPK
ncbi:MAG: hypothetical protein N4A71_02315 [Carboxylicivirga sp.]|nr:hypothetical protein [Carboxylicivirga sp.]